MKSVNSGEWLTDRMDAKNLSKTQIHNETGLSYKTLRGYLEGTSPCLEAKTWLSLAKVLQVKVGTLMDVFSQEAGRCPREGK